MRFIANDLGALAHSAISHIVGNRPQHSLMVVGITDNHPTAVARVELTDATTETIAQVSTKFVSEGIDAVSCLVFHDNDSAHAIEVLYNATRVMAQDFSQVSGAEIVGDTVTDTAGQTYTYGPAEVTLSPTTLPKAEANLYAHGRDHLEPHTDGYARLFTLWETCLETGDTLGALAAADIVQAATDSVKFRDAIIVRAANHPAAARDVLTMDKGGKVTQATNDVLDGIIIGRIPPNTATDRTRELLEEILAYANTREDKTEAVPIIGILAVMQWWTRDPQVSATVAVGLHLNPDYTLLMLVRDMRAAGLTPGQPKVPAH